MQNLNYWKQFESTGKIEDYLSYRNSISREEKLSDTVGDIRLDAQGVYAAGQLGENSYAGIHKCNGNDTEANAYRGI